MSSGCITAILALIAASTVHAAEVVPAAVPAGEPPNVKYVDCFQVTARVRARLDKHNLLEWSDELLATLDKADATNLVMAIEVFLRAGQPERVSKVIPLLSKHSVKGCHEYYPGRFLSRGLHTRAREWLDTFPDSCPSYHDMQDFILHFEKTSGSAELEAWLGEKVRCESPRAGMWSGNWRRLYWYYLSKRGKMRGYVAGLEKTVRREPSSIHHIMEYLQARGRLSEKDRSGIGWLGKGARLSHPVDAFVLARTLASAQEHDAAITLFDRSLAMEVTDYDRKNFNRYSMCSMYIPPDHAEPTLRRWTTAGLAQACFKAGKLERAQKLVQQLTGKKDGSLADLGPFLFAGQVQAATGQRVVEKRIKKAEKENRDSVQYWLKRARYYAGRKELEQEEEAYKMALKLPAAKRYFDVIRDYAWFLQRQERYREAEKLYRDEIARVGATSHSVHFWLNQLTNIDGKGGVRVRWDEPALWDYLAERKKHSFGQTPQWRLAWAAKKAGKQWTAFEKRLLTLAAAPAPCSLEYCAGRMLYRNGRKKEGLRMMTAAYARWDENAYPDDDDVGEDLMEIHLERSDWRSAERVFDRLQDHKYFQDSLKWLGRLAVSAAKTGAADDAMRLWKRHARLDLTNHNGLAEMASAGLAHTLRTYYSELSKKAPGNPAIAAALKELGQ